MQEMPHIKRAKRILKGRGLWGRGGWRGITQQLEKLTNNYTDYRVDGDRAGKNYWKTRGKYLVELIESGYSGSDIRDKQQEKKEKQVLRKEVKNFYKKFYQSFEWKQIRVRILERDGYRCVYCGNSPKTGAILNVDHIKPLKKYWSLRLNPENLQTLCSDCNHGKANSL